MNFSAARDGQVTAPGPFPGPNTTTGARVPFLPQQGQPPTPQGMTPPPRPGMPPGPPGSTAGQMPPPPGTSAGQFPPPSMAQRPLVIFFFTKSWKGYIFIAVCLSVNKIPAKQMHQLGHVFLLNRC